MEVGLLGPIELAVDGEAAPLTSGRARAVLAALALRHDMVVTTDELIDLVWGEKVPATVTNQLQIAIFRLRKVVTAAGLDGSTVFVTRPAGYRLASGSVGLDLQEFRSAVAEAGRASVQGDWAKADGEYGRALAFWRGRACQDVTGERIRAAASLLDSERVEVVERRLAVELLLGHLDVAQAAKLLDTDPMRERLWYLLILGHATVGRQADALATYRRARAVLAEELGLTPSTELQHLEGLVLRGELDDARNAVASWFGRQSLAAPDPTWQIPADLKDFIGRDNELARVSELLTDAPTVCLAGMGGVGKTTLAVRLAHDLRPRFPDGGLFVDMRGTESTPADPHDVMGTVLRCLGLHGSAIPEDRDALVGLYRAQLARRGLLVVLDNVFDEGQVRPLAPPEGRSRFLITSRRSLAGLDGAARVEIAVPDARSAVGLIGSIAGPQRVAREPDAARRLVELCGQLPLALRILGVRLSRQDSSLRRMADRLAEERSRLDELSVGDRDVRAVFALSIAQLSPLELTLLRRIGLLPVGHCPSWMAATLLDLPVPAAERVLESLAEMSLVTHSEEGSRFAVHDLTRLYAAELAYVAVDRDALRRTYEMALRLALRADERLPMGICPTPDTPGGELVMDIEDARAWFDAERSLLLTAARDAFAQGWIGLARLIVVAMANFAMLETYDHEWVEAAEGVLDGDDADGLAEILLALGLLRQNRGRYRDALAPLRRARRIFLRRPDTARAATVAARLGVSRRILGEPRLARACTDWAVAVLSKQDPTAQLGWALVNRGTLLMELEEDTAGAQRAYEHALAVMRSAGDRTGEANSLMLLAKAYLQQNPLDPRAQIFWQGVQMLEEIGDPVDLCLGQVGLAWQRLMAGRLDDARAEAAKALAQATDLQLLQAIQGSLVLSGQIAAAQGQLAEARAWFGRAVDHARQTAGDPALAEALVHLARAAEDLGDVETARKACEEALCLRTRMIKRR
jgi:DNA-binding SARP family transcriptional activator/tetratricopeptide (TPR) repeat protein